MDLNSAAKTNVRPPGGVIDISSCPITYYGKQYTSLNEMFADSDQGVLDSSKSTADLDLSGCRVSGVAVVGGSEMPHPENCTATACALNTDVTEVNKCGLFEVLFAPGDVHGDGLHGDRCLRRSALCPGSLCLQSDGAPGSASFNLMAAFRERRRTDVPLLDHLILLLPGLTEALGGFCETQYQDSVDISINCNRSTDHCNLMRQPPFSSCHEHTDPEPYISACTHTLCRYPSADGVDCQFLEAYAKACSLEANPCSDHEFCGEKHGSTRCFCRGLFASKYRATKSLGDPTVCRQDSASVVLAGCLLDDKGIDFSTLHLKDPSCKGHMDDKSHLEKKSQIVYKNTIMSSNRSSGGVIIRSDQFQIDFSCKYTQPELCGAAACIWSVELHSDDDILQRRRPPAAGRPEHGDPAEPEGLAAAGGGGLDANLVAIVTDSCWATNQASPDSNLRYDLIIKGCPNPADDTVQMQGNGQGTSSVFSFDMFAFSGASNEIYLHCKLELCPTQGQACAPVHTEAVGGALAGGAGLLNMRRGTLPSSLWDGGTEERHTFFCVLSCFLSGPIGNGKAAEADVAVKQSRHII
ncbi:hypothetical protein F7725_002579 [Dissostichus mawsoni]|uniref:ZP domain-containing protein n=1 Tax=Dissostichus mawsoni TaxID=36200 RepID=A0A7J5Y2Y8_DISMA|nr:hypothetical protein F7725_002579 [Dissostichus mawsoni]